MSKNSLYRNQELQKGDYLLSNNGNFKAIFQGDGNFVIYTWKPIWASDTAGSDAVRLSMQDDCNLVMHAKDGAPRWHTNSHKEAKSFNSCRLTMTDEGVLVLNKDLEQVWNSNKNRGMK